ncbi:MAG: HAD family phosphatase [Elusimicrobia bacterium]|nr:HAD family phosphatase [Elusimicrobiota bacterium]
MNKETLKAFIFDMDGVIIDSEPIYLEVNKKTFKKLKINISPKKYLQFIGVSNQEMWYYLKKKYNLNQSVKELVNLQVEGALGKIEKHNMEPIDGIPELLRDLKKNNIIMAVASSSSIKSIKTILKKLNIQNYFLTLVSGEEMKNGKPAPDIFLEAAKRLKVEPKNCIVIEDSEKGVRAAKSAGMKCIGFQNLNSYNQNLSKADKIVDTIKEINLKEFIKL